MLQITFLLSFAAAINDDAAMKIAIKLSDAFDISNDFYDTFQMENRAMVHFSIGMLVE